MSAKRARDMVESHPHDRGSYKILDPGMQEPGSQNEYAAMLLTIQVQLDRINANDKGPGPQDILTLRHISNLATEASQFRHKEALEP
jgi:hypothetical protein